MTENYFILELTTSCNLDCIYCYNVWKENEHYSHKNPSLEEVKKIFRNFREDSIIIGVTLAGGEPLLNDEIFDIASYLQSLNIKLNITTNGILLTQEKVLRLINCGVRNFEVSMPTSDSAIFKKLCGSIDLKKVRAAILEIKKQNAKLSVATVITKINFHETYDIIEIAYALGADYFMLNRFVPGGKGKEFLSQLKLNQSEIIQTLSEANKAARAFNIPVIIAIPVEHCIYDTSSFTKLNFGTCVCGDKKWVIDPWANLRCCEQNPQILGNLLSENFTSLIRKNEVKDFKINNFSENCAEQNCYSQCGGGCRFCRD